MLLMKFIFPSTEIDFSVLLIDSIDKDSPEKESNASDKAAEKSETKKEEGKIMIIILIIFEFLSILP